MVGGGGIGDVVGNVGELEVEALEISWGISVGGRWRHWRFSGGIWGMGSEGIVDIDGNLGGREVEALEI